MKKDGHGMDEEALKPILREKELRKKQRKNKEEWWQKKKKRKEKNRR